MITAIVAVIGVVAAISAYYSGYSNGEAATRSIYSGSNKPREAVKPLVQVKVPVLPATAKARGTAKRGRPVGSKTGAKTKKRL